MSKESRPAMKRLKQTINGKTTEEKTIAKLRVSREEAYQHMEAQIYDGEILRARKINSESVLHHAIDDCKKWVESNKDLLLSSFDDSSINRTYKTFDYHTFIQLDTENEFRTKDKHIQFMNNVDSYRVWVGSHIDHLKNIRTQYGISDMPLDTLEGNIGDKIFIGHGHSLIWRELKDFINERLELPYDEFNRVSIAGIDTRSRLKEMLKLACMAFLILTAEDERTDGTMHARENVIHEAGLFQGRLGFERAIILLEEGCEEFSNIQGLGQI